MLSTFRSSDWGYQYLTILLSLACFAALIILLAHFDQKPVFTWQGVTLNAIISILSVAIKAALAYVVSECLAQWKWILFWREERPLIDFDRIEGATRGPLGSLRVLLRTRGTLAVQLGAILTLLAIALDPLAQQLIQFRQGTIFIQSSWKDSSYVALNSRAPSYSMGTAVTTHGTFKDNSINLTMNYHYSTTEIPLSMQAAILNGLSRTPLEVDQEALVRCSTGNCTWDQFTTLGICHRCNDLTSELKRVDSFMEPLGAIAESNFAAYDIPSTAFALPNGHFIANVDGCPPYNGRAAECENGNPSGMYADEKFSTTSFGTGNPNKTVTMKDIETLLWSMSVISPDLEALNKSTAFTPGEAGKKENRMLWPDIPMKATECALYYCVKNVDSSVKENILDENITEATEARRNPDSWERDDDVLPGSIVPPLDELSSLEFHKNWSAVSYSDLILEFPGNRSKGYFYISESSVKSLSAHMQQLFLTNWTGGSETRTEIEKKLGKGAVGFNGASFGPFGDTFVMKSNPAALNAVWTWAKPDMSRLFYSLATSMTNEMRRNWETQQSKYHIMDQNNIDNQNVTGTLELNGKVGILTVVYDIKWGWITLHVVVTLSALGFLAITLWNSKGQEQEGGAPLWKSSTLAALKHGRVIGGLLETSRTVDEMEATARKSYVKVPAEVESDENTAWIGMTELERERGGERESA